MSDNGKVKSEPGAEKPPLGGEMGGINSLSVVYKYFVKMTEYKGVM